MKRLFLILTAYFGIVCCAINVFNCILEVKAQVPTPIKKGANKAAISLNNYEGDKKDPVGKKTNGKRPGKGLVLVPPPPPDAPALLDWSPLGGTGEFSSFLNETELKAKLQHMQSQINDARLKVKESSEQLSSSKDRVEQFNSLYAEGVISRKELDVTKKDVVDQEHLAEEAKNNLADLEIEQSALVRRLNVLKHNGKKRQIKSSKRGKG